MIDEEFVTEDAVVSETADGGLPLAESFRVCEMDKDWPSWRGVGPDPFDEYR